MSKRAVSHGRWDGLRNIMGEGEACAVVGARRAQLSK
jgi:hypothetical protein